MIIIAKINNIYNTTNCNKKNIMIEKNNNNKNLLFPAFIFIDINIFSKINFIVSNLLLSCLFFFFLFILIEFLFEMFNKTVILIIIFFSVFRIDTNNDRNIFAKIFIFI